MLLIFIYYFILIKLINLVLLCIFTDLMIIYSLYKVSYTYIITYFCIFIYITYISKLDIHVTIYCAYIFVMFLYLLHKLLHLKHLIMCTMQQ